MTSAAVTSLATRQADLLARKAQLAARLEQISGEFEAHDSRDWEEMATERETDEVLEDLGAAARRELRMIEAALARIAAGEYGYCARCGEKISEERLDLIPATPFCAAHADPRRADKS
ncbi:TraR/DksA family transcriptional regulator [Rhodobacter maris]|uniref:TraR/DksA family transcriptional regulator n=1 Tax=Rhodobacter maris TaxID=446682 RepID=A0A285RFJ4_9RHOB|nr:TraR/DksA C4-type zinc finger protein [Rhodobacter maris]SOB92876.1 TraR/DksA family transcriptional regulator [Rhodobacter maris]